MNAATFVVLVAAGLCFGYRLWRGPSVIDRVIAVDGLLVVGVAALVVNTMRTGDGSFVPVAVVTSLVGFVSTSVVARYVEGRGGEPADGGPPGPRHAGREEHR
ncbi:MAG TPA: monovalent cation/H+ antiporter complex subunit F [Ilumatobacter sp.]|nr:monovalent cation/H+ antiporter complex subunit F [Ilumatobacter sp.]